MTIGPLNHYGSNEIECKYLRHGYHEGQYLTEFEPNFIPNNSRQITFRDLVKGGLFDVILQLDDSLYRKSL